MGKALIPLLFFHDGVVIIVEGEVLMHDLQSIWRGLDWSVLTNLLLSIVPALVCITLHELAHGYVAYRLGDDTAKRAGRLTLNPIKHIDIMGLAMMVIFKFGWAKPVPVNMWKFKNPKKGMAICAAAGPLANILIAVVCLFLYGLLFRFFAGASKAGDYLLEMLYITAYLSTALAIFNIIPIPPLDGSKVLYSFISDRAYAKLMYYERYGMIFLVVAVFLLSRTDLNPLGNAAYWLMDKLFAAANWGFDLAGLFA